MLDLSNIPNSQQDIQMFQANGNAWQTWQKPRKCNYIYIICIGGGGGGAAGYPGNDVVYSTGGGAGGVSRALFNAQFLPDRLYVQVGLGGAGGNGGAGSAGSRSFVMLQPSTVTLAQNSIISSGAANANGGTFGTGANAPGENAVGVATTNFLSLSNFLATAGTTAVGSTTSQLPPDISALSSSVVTCGAGGGGIVTSTSTAYNGASITATLISPIISGGTGVSSGTGGNGANGITSFKPFYSLGGAGGGASLNGNGGNGGNGGIGCGGGAGGNGSNGFVGGLGGRGGNGLVMIISF